MIAFVKGVLKGDAVPLELTKALLVLIPKEGRPISIRNFRPISLCNVCIKLVTKVVVNLLKGVLGDLIASNQASFVPRRQGIDNVIICQEIIHTMRYTKSKRGAWY